MTLTVPGDGYLRNVLYTLNVTSMFLLLSGTCILALLILDVHVWGHLSFKLEIFHNLSGWRLSSEISYILLYSRLYCDLSYVQYNIKKNYDTMFYISIT